MSESPVATLVLANWKSLAGFGFLGAVVSAITVLALPSYYRAGAAFQAETQSPSALSGALAGLASQIGSLPIGSQSNPQLFADLLTTDAVLGRVANGIYPWRDGMQPLAEIYDAPAEDARRRDFTVVRKLRKAIDVDVNIRTGVVRFSVEARTPALAQALAESSLAALNTANISLRQARASAEQSFTAGRAEVSRQELTDAEGALAEFYQRNRIASSPSLQMEESRLRRAVEMAQQVYVQLRLQEEQAAVQAVRNTPAISVIDPPLLPVRRSWPQRRLAVMVGAIIGLAIGFLRISIRA